MGLSPCSVLLVLLTLRVRAFCALFAATAMRTATCKVALPYSSRSA